MDTLITVQLTDPERQMLLQLLSMAQIGGTPDQVRELLRIIDGLKSKLENHEEQPNG